MAAAIVFIGGLVGFLAAVVGGLVLGLGWIESFAVYFGSGLTVSMLLFGVKGLICGATRQLA